MSQEVLGGFEHQVLLAVLKLGGETYTVPVMEALADLTGRSPSPAAVYVTLRRLEDRGLLRSALRRPAEGGRSRRVFSFEPSAVDVLRESKRVFEGLWAGIPALQEG